MKVKKPASRSIAEDIASIARDIPIVSSGLVGRAARALRRRAVEPADEEGEGYERRYKAQSTDSNN